MILFPPVFTGGTQLRRMMVREAPAPPLTRMAVPAIVVKSCNVMVEFAGRVTLIWFSKLEADTAGATTIQNVV